MMDANLHDYSENNPPRVRLTKPILHPNNRTKAIGHIGVDKGRELDVATFPRKKSEHWFRGNSTSGLTGYGISEVVLDRLDRPGTPTIDRVIVIETDADRVIEYELPAFNNATIVAYAPELNESVIGDDAMRVDDDVYNDRQRVIPVDEARQVFDRNDVTISQ
jgi:hypothetical protein